jgi:DNA-binding transcriptional MerR regulator
MQSKVKQLNFQTPIKMYRIGEIVLHTPFSRQTIHNYTTMGLIHEAQWTEGGHRLYDETVFERLSQILDLKKTKTLFEIKQLLNQEDNNKPKPYSSKSSMAG